MESDPRFLNSETPAPEGPHFEALGHAGSEHYIGLETFPNPGCVFVVYTSDELIAHCPITKQPDFYTVEISIKGSEFCIESKSLKLWLSNFNNPDNGLFAEALAVFIRNEVGSVLKMDEEEAMEKVQVTLHQKSRGGITIRAIA